MAKVKQLQLNNEEIYPLTHESAVVDNDGVNLSSKLDQFATETYVNNKIAEVQLEGGNVDLSGYATKTDLSSHTNSTTVHVTASEKSAWNNKSTFSGNYNDLTNKPTIPGYKSFYGTCATEPAAAEKEVVIDDPNWKLEIGTIVTISFSNTNSASNVTINVNESGDYPIWYNTGEYTGSSSTACGTAKVHVTYVFNGTHWVWLSRSNYSTYSQATLGQGYGTCTTAEATLAKVCSLSSYSLAVGGIVSVKFTNAVPANSTLNVNNRGAKNIYYRGSAITNGIIKAGDTATFIYNGTQYHLISIDSIVSRIPTNVSELVNDSKYVDNIDLADAISDLRDEIPIVMQSSGQSYSTVMSQKATTDYVNQKLVELKGRPIVSSVEEMKDSNTEYVLSSTGTVWRYREYEKTVETPLFTNLITEDVVDEGTLNKRISSSMIYTDSVGVFSTRFIPYAVNSGDVLTVRVKGVDKNGDSGHRVLGMMSNAGAGATKPGEPSDAIPAGGLITDNGWSKTELADGTLEYTKTLKTSSLKTEGFAMTWRLKSTEVTMQDALNVIVTFNEPIEYKTETITVKEWYDTEIEDDSNPIQIVQVPGDSESAVMSQKAVTDLVRNAIGSGGGNGDSDEDYDTTEYEHVDSVDQMTDTSKMYISNETGTLWSYQSTTTIKPKNLFNPDTATLNKRIGSSLTEGNYTGMIISDFIPVTITKDMYMTVGGIQDLDLDYDSNFMVHYFDDTKACIKNIVGAAYGIAKADPLPLPVQFKFDSDLNGNDFTIYPYVRVRLNVYKGVSVTKEMIKDIYINISGITEEVIENKWVDTGSKPNYKIETVNNTEQMTDVAKNYVLSSTNTIWSYKANGKGEPYELYDPTKVSLNFRYTGSPGAPITHNGYMLTDYIPVVNNGSPKLIIKHNLSINGTVPSIQKCTPHDITKKSLGAMYLYGTSGDDQFSINKVDSNTLEVDLSRTTKGSIPTWLNDMTYVRIDALINSNSTSLDDTARTAYITSIKDPNNCPNTYGWVDTRVPAEYSNSGSSGASGYIDLLIRIDEVDTEVNDLDKRVRKIEVGGTGDLVVPSAWTSAVNECISKIKTHQRGRYCVTFPFFSDHHVRGGYTGLLIAKVMKECEIPFCIFGGDSISSGYMTSVDVMIEDEYKFKDLMSYIPEGRFIRTPGNHDGYCAVSANEKYYYEKEEIYDLFFRDIATQQNKHFDQDGTSLYVDDLVSKTRFIGLDVNRVVINNANSSDSIKDYQIEWLLNDALKFNEPGWGVVFFSHQPISNHGHANLSNPQSVYSALQQYKDGTDVNKAEFIGWFSGHLHKDLMYDVASDGTALPFKQVIISSDATNIAYDDATKHPLDASDQSHCIDFVTINRKSRTVNITRLGIGNDRIYQY